MILSIIDHKMHASCILHPASGSTMIDFLENEKLKSCSRSTHSPVDFVPRSTPGCVVFLARRALRRRRARLLSIYKISIEVALYRYCSVIQEAHDTGRLRIQDR